MNLTINCRRGCGDSRDKKGVYLCHGPSSSGKPIEDFILDPVKVWPDKWQRGFKIMPAGDINHIVIFVGKEYYPSLWSFVEEVKRFGVSRKVPPTFPFEQLTPGKSKMYFCHAFGEAAFDFECNRELPLLGCKYQNQDQTVCTYSQRDLSYYIHPDCQPGQSEEDQPIPFTVNMPSFSFDGVIPSIEENVDPKQKKYWNPGLFLALILTHVETPHKSNLEAKNRANKAGYEVVVTDY